MLEVSPDIKGDPSMKAQSILAALLLAASSPLAFAENGDTNSLSGKAMHDLPGNNGAGTTANTSGNGDTTSLSGKAMHDQPGNSGGGTTAKTSGNGDTTSLSGKAMQQLPGNK
jgi:hypothetical protein